MVTLQDALSFFRRLVAYRGLALSGRGPTLKVVLGDGTTLRGKVTAVRPVRGRMGGTRVLLKVPNGKSILLDPKRLTFRSLSLA